LYSPFLFLSLLFGHLPAHQKIHEAPHHVSVLKNPPACDASRLRRLESSRSALLFGCLACGADRWHSLRRLALADSQIVAAVQPIFRIFESQVGAPAPTSPLSAGLGLSCRRLATAGNEALGRWGLPPPHQTRSSCLADGSLLRVTKRLVGGGCRPHISVFCCARLALQTARYRRKRSACHPARTLAHSHRGHDAASYFSRRCARIR